MTKEQFVEWKTSPVTMEIFNNIRETVEKMEKQLTRSVGEDTKMDLIRRGYVLAMDDLLLIEFDDTEAV